MIIFVISLFCTAIITFRFNGSIQTVGRVIIAARSARTVIIETTVNVTENIDFA